MNKREAERIARDIERHGLTVTGYRRYDYGKRGASWAVDVEDTETGYAFTVNEPGQWYERQSQYGNIAATPGRPTISANGEKAVRLSITLPPDMAAWVQANGNGNASAGVRAAVQFAWDMERAEAEAEALAPTYNGGRW